MSINIPFFRNKPSKEVLHEPIANTPEHIAIIMDGNGRWAQQRGMPRTAGHKEGISAIIQTVRTAAKQNIKVLTLYTFSTENWKRPKSEVNYIMQLPKQFLQVHLPELIANNVQIRAIGDIEHLPSHTREAIQFATERTKNNTGLLLNIAINYGGRHEILNAMKKMMADMNDAKLSPDELDEQLFSKYLYTAGMTEPDLLIRTGGEKRISNFLLWQLAYTEFWFTDVLWPDFSEEELLRALREYSNRKRRYGAI